MRGQSHAPAALYPRERPGTHCTGGRVGPRAGLDRCGKSRPPTGVRCPVRPARSQTLYRLRYPGNRTPGGNSKSGVLSTPFVRVTEFMYCGYSTLLDVKTYHSTDVTHICTKKMRNARLLNSTHRPTKRSPIPQERCNWSSKYIATLSRSLVRSSCYTLYIRFIFLNCTSRWRGKSSRWWPSRGHRCRGAVLWTNFQTVYWWFRTAYASPVAVNAHSYLQSANALCGQVGGSPACRQSATSAISTDCCKYNSYTLHLHSVRTWPTHLDRTT